MDIAGAKALKQRIGPNGTDEARPASSDVPEDAPPVYHWTGVSQRPEPRPDVADDDAAEGVSLFSWLGLNFR